MSNAGRPQKYSVTDVRICRALRHLLEVPHRQIGEWLGIPPKAVDNLIHHRKNIPVDNDESRRALLRWWLLQQLPTRVHSADKSAEESQSIIKRFNECLADAEALRKRKEQQQ